MAKAFRDLTVWQKAMDLSVAVYAHSERFPKTEIYGLTSQMRRAAVSIASNIAEGAGRSTKRDFCQFVAIAKGSSYELQTQILLASRLGYLTPKAASELEAACIEIGKMLGGLSAFLQDTKTKTQN